MGFPDVDPSAVGDSGLLWLFLTYGYALYAASNMISEGSDLLLLVPSLAGIVGSCVLPVLGAVPDGAIMLFSGLGSVEEAQENLAVGVGALAGSTIMLLTIPFALSLYAGRVDLKANGDANYGRKPKLSAARALSLSGCGVQPGAQVRSGAVVMCLTCCSYGIIQGPAFLLAGDDAAAVSRGEHVWALAGLVCTLGGFVAYLVYQVRSTDVDAAKQLKQESLIKGMVQRGEVSLAGAMADLVNAAVTEGETTAGDREAGAYGTVVGALEDSIKVKVSAVVRPFFERFDRDKSGQLDLNEVEAVFRDLGEGKSPEEVKKIFDELDTDKSGEIDFDEFVAGVCNHVLHRSDETEATHTLASAISSVDDDGDGAGDDDDDDDDDEEVPEDIADLTPARQRGRTRVIQRRFNVGVLEASPERDASML